MRCLGHAPGRARDMAAQVLRDKGARRDLDELLMTPLNRAFPLPQMADAAVPIANDLYLDVTRPSDQPLDIDLTIAESGPRFGPAARIGFIQLCLGPHRPHAAPAAPRYGLDHHCGIRTERSKERVSFLQARRLFRAFDQLDATGRRKRLSPNLVTEQIKHLRPRPDKGQLRARARPRECGVLTQKAVARMNRIAPGLLGGGHDRIHVEIGPRTRLRERMRFVGLAQMQGIRVVLREHGNGPDAKLGGAAGDADRDLAAIGDEQFPDCHELTLRSER
jgi:hypothetical protein